MRASDESDLKRELGAVEGAERPSESAPETGAEQGSGPRFRAAAEVEAAGEFGAALRSADVRLGSA